MPISLLDDTNNEDEGMTGKILHAVRNNHREISNKIDKVRFRFDENQLEISDARAKIDEI